MVGDPLEFSYKKKILNEEGICTLSPINKQFLFFDEKLILFEIKHAGNSLSLEEIKNGYY